MSIPSRPTKPNGSTDFNDGETLTATLYNGDLNPVYSVLDGDVDDDNIVASADIQPSKIGDYASSRTIHRTSTSPGASGSESYATDLTGELARLRYAIYQNGVGTSAQHYDGSSTEVCYWGDVIPRGHNHIRNGSFEIMSGTVPEYWTEEGAGGTFSQVATSVTNGTGYALRCVAAASNASGVSQQLTGLKASTKYFVSARVKVNTAGHHVRLVTAGADSTAGVKFQDIDIASTSTTATTLCGVIQTDSSASAVTVKIIANADATADSFDVDDVQFRECNTNAVGSHGYLVYYRASTQNSVLPGTTNSAAPGLDALTVDVTVPGPGYTVVASAAIRFEAGANALEVTGSVREDGTEKDTGVCYLPANKKGEIHLCWVNPQPTPGTTYTYETFIDCDNTGGNYNPTSNAHQLKSWLKVELIPPAF